MMIRAKNILKNVSFFVFSVVCLCFQLFGSDVEEGWRYHGSLQVGITGRGPEARFDFSDLHGAMATTLHSQSNPDQYSCLIRFTPLFVGDEGIEMTPTVKVFPPADTPLPSAEVMPYEVGFTSGFCDHTIGEPLWRYRQPFDLQLRGGYKKTEVFSLWPSFHKEKKDFVPNTLTIRFIQRNHIDPELFEDRLQFRYPDSPTRTIFERGNYAPIYEVHTPTKRQLEERRARLTRECEDIHRRIIREDVERILTPAKREELKKASRAFHDNAGVNSYTCAEQTGLDYLWDERVMRDLQRRLRIDDSQFVGCIVHVHCSHTPCHSCATSLSREMEPGGVFTTLVNDRPVFLLGSCQNHYERKPPMLPYERTTYCRSETPFVEQLDNPTVFDLASPLSRPYPWVLLEYEPRSGIFQFDRRKVLDMVGRTS